MARVNPRLEGWHFFALGVSTSESILAVRKWCKENFVNGFKIEKQMFESHMVPGFQFCKGLVVWIESDDDFLLFKLRWWDHQ